ncbi:hypothetical protein H8959_009300, partial [Pygathrix nigripes]
RCGPSQAVRPLLPTVAKSRPLALLNCHSRKFHTSPRCTLRFHTLEETEQEQGKIPREHRKLETQGDARREGLLGFSEEENSPGTPSPPLPSAAWDLPCAPPGPARLRASPQERGPMDGSGPAPLRADWPPPRWPRLIS